MADARAGNKRRGGGGGGRGGKKGRFGQDPSLRDQSGQALALGTRGVLITCEQSKEDRSANDAAALFEEHYQKLKAAPSSSAPAAPDAKAEGVKDIGALIAAEVASLKDQSGKMFKTHHTGVKGCVYVTFPNEPEFPAPQDVVLSICKETRETKTVPSRTIMRMMPVSHTCYASLDNIKEMAPKLLTGQFPEEGPGVEYAVDYEHRSADNFDRMTVINAFVDLMKPPHQVNLTNPAKSVLVQILRNVCGASVVEKYREYMRYNLRKLAEPEEDDATKAEKAEKEEKARQARLAKKTAVGGEAKKDEGEAKVDEGETNKDAAEEAETPAEANLAGSKDAGDAGSGAQGDEAKGTEGAAEEGAAPGGENAAPTETDAGGTTA